MNDTDPTPLIEMTTAYWQSQTLFTANRIGLFPALADGPLSTADIAKTLKTDLRSTELFLNACTALGLLEKTQHGYQNSPLSAAYLVPGQKTYLGNAIRYSDNIYQAWGRLEQTLKTGGPALPAATYLGKDPQQTRDFVYGMHNRALAVGYVLANLVDLTGRKQLLDVGGGPGTYSALLVQRFPQLRTTVLDLPEVVQIAEEILTDFGVTDRVSCLPGDYLKTPFPKGYDVVLISGVFHGETEANCQNLITKARECLGDGGQLIICDVFTEDDGSKPQFATLFGLNMLLTAPHGGVHAEMDVTGWLQDAGFDAIELHPFPPPLSHRLLLAG